MEQDVMPRFVLAADMSIVWMSPSARSALEGLGLRVDGRGLVSGTTPASMRSIESVRRQLRVVIGNLRTSGSVMSRMTLRELPDAMVELCQLVVGGRFLIGCTIVSEKPRPNDVSSGLQRYGLTRREREVVLELAKGSTAREIARANGSSVLTVRTHIKRAYAKMGVNCREKMFARLASRDLVRGATPSMSYSRTSA